MKNFVVLYNKTVELVSDMAQPGIKYNTIKLEKKSSFICFGGEKVTAI